jgi:hypothetical protein
MSAAEPAFLRLPARRLLPVACGLLLALAMIRLPVVTDVEPAIAYRTILYEHLRLGQPWTEALTPDGPLAALQTPAYLGGSIWMAVAWQVGGNLLLAGVLVAAAFRLPWSRRGWALAALALGLSRWPECAPWLVMTLLGYDLIRDWAREPQRTALPALVLGFLGLFSLGHLLLGVLVVGFTTCTARPPLSRAAIAGAFFVGLAGGWLALGQAWPELGRWVVHSLPQLWTPSALDRFAETGALSGWALVATVGFVLLVLVPRALASPPPGLPAATCLLLGSAWLAWRVVVLQPNGAPAVFFGTVILGSFLLWPRDRGHHRWAILPAALAFAGLAGSQPGFLSDALGHLNRQAVFSVRQLAALGQLRPALGAQVRGLRQGHAWPHIQAAVGRTPVAALGDATLRALLNNLVLAPTDLRAPAALEGADAPRFVIQGLPATPELAPALVDVSAQWSLFRHYEPQLVERGYLLWRRKPETKPAPPALVAHGALRLGEPLALPTAPAAAYRLELDLHRSWLGLLWSLFGQVPEPGLVVQDESGRTLRYALPAAAARGFLVDPLVRGNVEFDQWLAGTPPSRSVAVEVAAPAGWAWLWSQRYTYRLSAVPGPAFGGDRIMPATADWHAVFNRLPLGTRQAIPFGAAELAPGDPVLFAHPASIVEFAITGADRRLHGSFGLLPGSFQGPSTTDGVDFSVEFIGADGVRRVLYHRYLNPRDEIADQGTQYFTVALPAESGRLLLRTWNPPYRTAAWDWAFWRNVVID